MATKMLMASHKAMHHPGRAGSANLDTIEPSPMKKYESVVASTSKK
jgi:hypothetical protein